MNRVIKALLFDLDGTLIDSLPDIVRSVNELRRSRGLTSITRGSCLGFIGKGAEHLVRGCLPGLMSSGEFLQAVAEYQNYYRQGPMRSKLFSGVERGLKLVKGKFPNLKFAVVTNKSTRLANEALAHLLPKIIFDDVRGADSVKARKPDPSHAHAVLEAINVRPDEALMLGDDPVDYELAQNARLKFLGASWGYGDLASRVENPELLCKNFSEFVEKVTNHLGERPD